MAEDILLQDFFDDEVLEMIEKQFRKIVVAKSKFAHAYMINMLYLNTRNITRLIGVLALVPAALVPIHPDRLVIFCSIQSITYISCDNSHNKR